jgi:hypothetical protein
MNKKTAFESKLEKTSNFSLEKYGEQKPASSLSHLDKPNPSPIPSSVFISPEAAPQPQPQPQSQMNPPPLPPAIITGVWRKDEEIGQKKENEGEVQEWGGWKMDYPVMGIDKLKTFDEITLRPKVVERGREREFCFWGFPGGRRKEQMMVEPMFYIHVNDNFFSRMIK